MNLFQKITAKNIIAYQQKLADDLKLSPSTIKRRLSSIRKFSQWATKQGYLQENPFRIIPNEDEEEKTTVEKYRSLAPKEKGIISKAYKAYHNLPIAKYLNYAILIIFCAALGFGIYDQFFKKTPTPFAYSDTPTRPNRYLSFQGRLTDSSDNPISSATNIDFKLWKLVSGGTEGACIGDTGEDCLWKSNTCVVTPDQDGIFSIMLGTTTGPGYTCDTALEIGEDVFTKNQNVWLGITVDTDAEMDPRIQVATVGYALNAETLQGMPPGTGINSIPYINNAGDIIIAAASPSIQGTSGTFAIEGQTGVTIQAGTGVGGSITISPKGDNGIINLTSEATTGNLLNNQSGASFGTVGGKEENNLYYGYAGTDSTNLNLLKLESGSTPIAKFTIDAAGNASAAGILKAMTTGSYLTGDITVSGGDITGANGVSLDIGEADANYITSSVGLAVGGAQNYYINSSGTGNLNALTLAGDLVVDTNDFFVDVSGNMIGIGTTALTEKLTIAGNATISGTLALGPQTLDYAGACNVSTAGKMYYDGDANKYYFCNGTSWTEMGSGSSGDSWWTESFGALYPVNTTLDLLVGGDSTASANVRLAASNTENSFIMGNFGIGTTTPTAKLEVVGNTLLGVGLSGTEDALEIDTSTGFSGNLLKLAVNNAEKFSIDATGMLTTTSGIFTSTVADGASAIGFKLITPEYTNPGAKLFSVFNNTDEKFSIDQSGTGTFYGDGTGSLIDNTSGDITIDAAGNNISLAGDYLINVGRIGIGRTVPSVALDIAGDATLSGALSLAPQVQAYAGVCSPSLAGKMYYDAAENKYYYCNGTTWSQMGSGAGGDSWWTETSGLLHPVNSTLDLAVGGNSTTSANVKLGSASNIKSFIMGGLGIGTTNPIYNLDIAGTDQLLNIGSGGWGDKTYGGFNGRAYVGYDGDGFATLQGADGKGIKLNVNSDTFGSGAALTIDSAGYVGIGTAAPDSLFSVGATSQFKVDASGNLTTSGTITAATNGTINGVDINAGTISDATWNGTAVGTQYGGTGQDWSATAQGSLPYFSGAGTMSTLAPNTAGYVLQTNGAGANPTWVDISSTAGPWTLVGNNLYPDSTSYNVGIGTTTPTAKLQVVGTTILGNGLTGSEDALLVNTGAAFSGNLLKLSVNGTQKLAIDSTGQLITASGTFLSTVADSGSAIAYNFDTLIAMTAPGAKLLSVKNAGDEKMSLDKDGVLALYNSESKIYNSSGDITIDAASGNISFATNSLINIDDLTLGGIASMSGTPNLTLVPTANLAKIYLLNGGDLGLYSSVGGDTGVGQILKIFNNGEATISGTLSLAPQVQAFAGTCNASSAGKMYYDAAENKYYYCNGTSWTSVGTNYWTLSGNNLYPNLTDYSIGIGTTDPGAYKLYVVGDMAAASFVDSANSDYFVDPAAAGTSATFFGNVGIGTTTPGSKLDVNGDINFTGKLLEDGVEVFGGVIAIWSGSTASIPSGWYLCDGTNGTPDLRNRFVVGAGGSYGVGATGGAASVNSSDYVENGSTSFLQPAASGYSYHHYHTVATLPPYYALAYIMKKTGADLAEWVPSTGDNPPGTIVSIDSEKTENVKASEKPYDTKVAGIIATSPDTIMGTQALGDVQMALSGRVPTKVSLINGSIKIGDPITTSSIPGVGMKANQTGSIVAKSMEAFDENSSTYDCQNPTTGEIEKCGSILAFVNVSWYSPETNTTDTNESSDNNPSISDPNYQFLRFKEEISEGDLVNIEYQQITDGAGVASYLSKAANQSKPFTGVISKTINSKGELLKREFNGSEVSNETRLVTNGNTKVKISPLSETIQAGDLLTLSDNPGMAAKAFKLGSTIGKALESWTSDSNKETIQVLVTSGWYDPDVYLTSTGQLNITYDAQLSEEYQLKDEGGNLIKKIGAFAEVAVANLKAGLITTKELIANKISSQEATISQINSDQINTNRISLSEITTSDENNNIVLNLENQNSTESAFGKLIIKGEEGQNVASIDALGNASFNGELSADSLQIENDATISGILYAEDLMTKKGSFNDLLNASPAATYITQNITNVYQTATSSANEVENETNTSEIAVDEEASSSAIMSDEEINDLINEILASTPEVASQAALAENIEISTNTNSETLMANSLTIGNTLTLTNDSLNSIAGPLYLQNLGLGGIDLLAGKIIIDQQGNATFEENLTVKGTLAAKSISPLPENDLVIDLAQIPVGDSAPETESKFGNLLIKGINNEVVASIDASGSAHFTSLGIEADYSATKSGMIIAAYDNLQKNGEYSPAIETNATAGMGVLPTYEQEIIIYNDKVTDASLIYITPLNDTNNKVIFVKAKKTYKAASIDESGQYLPEEKGWFKVSIDTPIDKEIQFNWWIVN